MPGELLQVVRVGPHEHVPAAEVAHRRVHHATRSGRGRAPGRGASASAVAADQVEDGVDGLSSCSLIGAGGVVEHLGGAGVGRKPWLVGLAVAITCAPSETAICTAKKPTPPEAAVHQHPVALASTSSTSVSAW